MNMWLQRAIAPLFIFCIEFFFRAFSGSQQNWAESAENSHTPPVPFPAASPPSISPIRVVHLLQSMSYTDTLSPIVHTRVHSWWYTFCGFWQVYNDCIHHFHIIQSSFTVLKIPCAPLIHSFLPQALPLFWKNKTKTSSSHCLAKSRKLLYQSKIRTIYNTICIFKNRKS